MKNSIYIGILITIVGIITSCSKNDSDFIENNIAVNKIEIDTKKLLDLVNEVRTSGTYCDGVYYPAVEVIKWNAKLEQAALNHSNDMFVNDFFDHTSSNGDELTMRLKNVGYSYTLAGENIAFGYSNEQDVIAAWLTSPGHCANIMNGNFKELGIARVGDYWTQDFGAQQSN